MKATHIAVVSSGWVFVGTEAPDTSDNPHKYTLTGAACIRKWGTQFGLGQLAIAGPQKDTVLDTCGTVEIERRSLLFVLPVDQTKWR